MLDLILMVLAVIIFCCCFVIGVIVDSYLFIGIGLVIVVMVCFLQVL